MNITAGVQSRLVGLLAILCVGTAVGAGVPLQINHQGVVQVGGIRFNGTGLFRFAIVDPDTGNQVWTNDGSNMPGPGTPTAAVSVTVTNGVYSVALGDVSLTNMTAVPSTVFNDDNVVLRIWFDDGANGVEQLTPDHVLGTSPYAFQAANATSAVDADTVDGFHAADLLATQPPIGSILAWHKNLTGVPALPSSWLECNGQAVSDPASPLNGQTLPDLNGQARFLRGSSVSGTEQADATDVNGLSNATNGVHGHQVQASSVLGGADNAARGGGSAGTINILPGSGAHSHTISSGDSETRPVNMSVVWIMRVK